MLYLLIFIFLAYTFVKIYISLIQINFIKKEMCKEAVILEHNEYQNAGKIAIENEKFEIATSIFQAAIFVCWASFGLELLYSAIVKNNLVSENLTFVLSFLIISTILSLPFSIYERFVKDKKHGFSNMNAKIFILDLVKSLLLLISFGSLFIYIILLCIDYLGVFWWFFAFLISFAISLIINLIYPTLIAPLFNKMSMLEDTELKTSIESLLNSCGFKSSGIFVIDASKRDNRLNAYFGGLGATKRVVLFDTLINKLSLDEIIAVLGHELGHFKHKDILKMIAISFFMLFFMFFIFGNIPNSVYEALGISGSGSILIFLILFSPIFSLIFTPISSYFSRKNEFNADKFGAKVKNKNDMISALKKLGSENKAFPKAHHIYSKMYHTHPSLFERIKELSK